MATVIVSLQCMPESFHFDAKRIPLPKGSSILLGSVNSDSPRDVDRTALPSNGFFPSKLSTPKGREPVTPLALSACHAEIWLHGNQIMFRDLDAPFGTFVNGVRLKGETILKSGDIVSLGQQLPRNSKTPTSITDDHLKPVIAKVTISVASQF
ncbi:hypothetical protein AX17_001811 [Amanita inopinata Kibby_2008]|nr:hypothetical protein AX17_001811 [Amanita inopinata Kibby_2008]